MKLGLGNPICFNMFFALVLFLTLKEKRKYKSEKEFESEEKRKSAVTFVTALFFLVAWTKYPDVLRRLNGPQRGLYYEKPNRFALFIFAFQIRF